MSAPIVHCLACDRGWYSQTLAEGLRALGRCPRCGGELVFDAITPAGAPAPAGAIAAEDLAPHQVMGLPKI